jgi:hypothetical protein
MSPSLRWRSLKVANELIPPSGYADKPKLQPLVSETSQAKNLPGLSDGR